MQRPRNRLAALAIVAATAVLAGTEPAGAAKLRFGSDETLTRYADTGIRVGGDLLSLCYKATTQWFIAGVYTTDEAVLCDAAGKRYWPLPAGDQLKQLQQRGLLPDPLPRYERPIIEYAFGYSLWVVIGVLVLGGVASRLLTSSQNGKALGRHKTLVRRVMAETLDARPGADGRAEAAARAVYERVFGESLAAGTFAEDRTWVAGNQDAYRAYFGAMAKNVDPGLKALLLRIATALTFELGRADDAGWTFLVGLATRLGLDETTVTSIVNEMAASKG